MTNIPIYLLGDATIAKIEMIPIGHRLPADEGIGSAREISSMLATTLVGTRVRLVPFS